MQARQTDLRRSSKSWSNRSPRQFTSLPRAAREPESLIVNLDKESDIPRFAEPWFLAFNASVELTPAMTPEDLAAAASDLEAAVKSFG